MTARLVGVTDEGWERDVASATAPVVVDFWAPWCRPCRTIEPALERLAARYGDRASFLRLDVDAHPAAAARWGVLSLPTVIVFLRGEPVETVVGARPPGDYERALAAALRRPRSAT